MKDLHLLQNSFCGKINFLFLVDLEIVYIL